MITRISVLGVLGRTQEAQGVFFIPSKAEELFWKQFESAVNRKFHDKNDQGTHIAIKHVLRGDQKEDLSVIKFLVPHSDPDTVYYGLEQLFKTFQTQFWKDNLDDLPDAGGMDELSQLMELLMNRFPARAEKILEEKAVQA